MSTEDDTWLRTMLQSAPAGRTAACLDAERLAAWSEGALTAQERSDVELHLSTCPHCMSALAALQRTQPAPAPSAGFDRARLFRWLVPMTAAATAVAIWVVVPDRHPLIEQLPTVSRTVIPEPEPQAPTQQAPAQAQPERYSAIPEAENRALKRESARADSTQLRDQARRSRETDTQAKAESTDLAAPAPPPAAAAPAPMAPPARAEESTAASPSAQVGAALKESAARESAADASLRATARGFAPAGSVSSADPSVHWRLAKGGAAVERSTDAGQTWRPVPQAPGVSPGPPVVTITALRGVDANRAIAGTSDGRTFFTTDAGKSWTLLQENQTAPF